MTAEQILALAAMIADLRLQVGELAAANDRLAARNAELEAAAVATSGVEYADKIDETLQQIADEADPTNGQVRTGKTV